MNTKAIFLFSAVLFVAFNVCSGHESASETGQTRTRRNGYGGYGGYGGGLGGYGGYGGGSPQLANSNAVAVNNGPGGVASANSQSVNNGGQYNPFGYGKK